MAKDPALLFYTSDFLMSTLCLSMEDRGKYITILCLMHQQGRLSLEEMEMALHCNVSEKILKKFKKDEFDKFYSERLEEEKEKRAAFVKSRKNSTDINNGDMVHIYLIKDPNKELYKIGSSKYPYLRIKEVVKYKPGADFYWISPELAERKLEKELHDKYASKKERYDWFFLDSEDLENIKNLFRINLERCRTVNEIENINETVLEKGVQGEKQSFKTMPQPGDVGDLPDVKIQAAIEALKIQTDQTVDAKTVVEMWGVFKIQFLTGKNFYPDVGKVESHFLNWILKKKFERNGIGKTKQERTTDSLTRLAQRGAEALERIRSKSS